MYYHKRTFPRELIHFIYSMNNKRKSELSAIWYQNKVIKNLNLMHLPARFYKPSVSDNHKIY